MKKNMTKKLIALFLCVTMVGVLLLAGVNFIVDPFHFFRWNSGISQDPGNSSSSNRRSRAACVLKNSPSDTYQGIIIGGSKSFPLSEELLNTYTGLNWMSCSTSGGNFGTYETIIWYALDHQQLEHVILHLSGYEVYGDINSTEFCRIPDFVYSGSDVKDNIYYLFTGFENSIDNLADGTAPSLTNRFSEEKKSYYPFDEANLALAHSMGFFENMEMDETDLNLVESRIQSVKVSGYDYYYGHNYNAAYASDEKAEWIDFAVVNHEVSYNESLQALFYNRKNLKHKDESIRHLKKIIELCEAHNVELTVVLGATFLTERKNYEGQEYWDYLYQISQLTDFYDFSYFCDINMNPYNFYDSRHNLDFIACVMIDNLYGEGVIPFGQKVTADNFEDYIAQRKADYFALEQEYRETGTVQLEELGSESDLSSLPAEFWLEMRD